MYHANFHQSTKILNQTYCLLTHRLHQKQRPEALQKCSGVTTVGN
ncbi:hypothetical protein F385_2172 [Pantoea agglomerans 299R]|nr:hypothetical protein F385_2172 [Pantoea agglomerans 299R]